MKTNNDIAFEVARRLVTVEPHETWFRVGIPTNPTYHLFPIQAQAEDAAELIRELIREAVLDILPSRTGGTK